MASPFTPEELAYLEAHKDDSRVSEIMWVYTVPIAAATISTGMRLWAKCYGRNGITLDDYLILVATVRAFCFLLISNDLSHSFARYVLSDNARVVWVSVRYHPIFNRSAAEANNSRPSSRYGQTCNCRLSL